MTPKRLPPKNNPPPWQSHLEPYSEEIFGWRRANKSYRAIKALLFAEKGISIHHGSIAKFVIARSKRAKAKRALLADLAVPDAPAPVSLPERRYRPVSAPSAASSNAGVVSGSPSDSKTPQTNSNGLPLRRNEVIIGTDSSGRNITANRPFKGKI